MNLDTFIRKLTAVRNKGTRKFRLNGDGIRVKYRGAWQCPINIVAEQGNTSGYYHEDASFIRLKKETAEQIAAAADDNTPTPLRKRLLRACGLQEKK